MIGGTAPHCTRPCAILLISTLVDEGLLSCRADNDFTILSWAPENIDETIHTHGPSGGQTVSLATILVEEKNIGVVAEGEDEVLLGQSSDDEQHIIEILVQYKSYLLVLE